MLAQVPVLCYILNMMNDMMPTIEETITPDIQAQLEHEEWSRDQERRERWDAIEAQHGQLFDSMVWKD